MSFFCHLSKKIVNFLLINRDWLLISQAVLCQSLWYISPKITAALRGKPSLHSRFLDQSFTVLCCVQSDLSRFFEPRSVMYLGLLPHPHWSLRFSTAERRGGIMVADSTRHSLDCCLRNNGWRLPCSRQRWVQSPMRKLVCRISVARRLASFAVIGLTRIYCNQSDEFCLVDVFSQDAPRTVEHLREQGWEIEAEIPVWDRLLKRSNDFCVARGSLYD